MTNDERLKLFLQRCQQIDARINSLEIILNTILFKSLVNEFMITKIEPSNEKKADAELEVGKAMGRMKAKIDAHVEDKDIPRYKKYLPEMSKIKSSFIY